MRLLAAANSGRVQITLSLVRNVFTLLCGLPAGEQGVDGLRGRWGCPETSRAWCTGGHLPQSGSATHCTSDWSQERDQRCITGCPPESSILQATVPIRLTLFRCSGLILLPCRTPSGAVPRVTPYLCLWLPASQCSILHSSILTLTIFDLDLFPLCVVRRNVFLARRPRHLEGHHFRPLQTIRQRLQDRKWM